MSDRTRRVDHLLQEEISAIIQREVHDPRVGFVTMTSVETTPDLQHAMVFVSVIGNEGERKSSLAALGRAMPFVRHNLGKLRLRRVPDLHLREDDSAVRGTRVMQLLEQVEVEFEGGADLPAIQPAEKSCRCPHRPHLNDPAAVRARRPPAGRLSPSRRSSVFAQSQEAPWSLTVCGR